MSRRNALVAWLLPLVLIGVAGHQVWLATTGSLTSWKGGGFGMFATADPSSFRAVRGTFETPDGPVHVDLHALDDHRPEAHKTFQNARALPDERRLRQLADLVLRSRWRLVGDVAELEGVLDAGDGEPVLRAGPGPDAEPVEVTGGRIEVWRVRYDRGTQTVRPELAGSLAFTDEVTAAAGRDTGGGQAAAEGGSPGRGQVTAEGDSPGGGEAGGRG